MSSWFLDQSQRHTVRTNSNTLLRNTRKTELRRRGYRVPPNIDGAAAGPFALLDFDFGLRQNIQILATGNGRQVDLVDLPTLVA